MAFETTKQRVLRGTLSDAEDEQGFVLFKRVSELRATYQIRLQIYRAFKENRRLAIHVPERCRIHDDLKALADAYPRNVVIVRS
jgi:hypothetical protein